MENEIFRDDRSKYGDLRSSGKEGRGLYLAHMEEISVCRWTGLQKSAA